MIRVSIRCTDSSRYRGAWGGRRPRRGRMRRKGLEDGVRTFRTIRRSPRDQCLDPQRAGSPPDRHRFGSRRWTPPSAKSRIESVRPGLSRADGVDVDAARGWPPPQANAQSIQVLDRSPIGAGRSACGPKGIPQAHPRAMTGEVGRSPSEPPTSNGLPSIRISGCVDRRVRRRRRRRIRTKHGGDGAKRPRFRP